MELQALQDEFLKLRDFSLLKEFFPREPFPKTRLHPPIVAS
jgi:hypothetical protein